MLYVIPKSWLPGGLIHVETATGDFVASVHPSLFSHRARVQMATAPGEDSPPDELTIKKSLWTSTYSVMKPEGDVLFQITKSSLFRERYEFSLRGIDFELRKPFFSNRFFELYRQSGAGGEHELTTRIQAAGVFSRCWEVDPVMPLPAWLEVCMAISSRMIYANISTPAGA